MNTTAFDNTTSYNTTSYNTTSYNTTSDDFTKLLHTANLVQMHLAGNLTVGNETFADEQGRVHPRMFCAFAEFYRISVVPSMGDAFNTFYPALLLSISFLVLTNLVNRILIALKMEKYQFGAEIITEEQLKEGKRLLERQKKVMVASLHNTSYVYFYVSIHRPFSGFLYARLRLVVLILTVK